MGWVYVLSVLYFPEYLGKHIPILSSAVIQWHWLPGMLYWGISVLPRWKCSLIDYQSLPPAQVWKVVDNCPGSARPVLATGKHLLAGSVIYIAILRFIPKCKYHESRAFLLCFFLSRGYILNSWNSVSHKVGAQLKKKNHEWITVKNRNFCTKFHLNFNQTFN